MKKKLNENEIKNELDDSAFFRHSQDPDSRSEATDENRVKARGTRDPGQREKQNTMRPRHHDTMLEHVRKELREFGKEAATHRFTSREKREIAELIYSYKKKGVRTSENEIARIAINYILDDYKNNKAKSILAQVLEMLNS